MIMSENKTKVTDVSVEDYLAAIEDESRRADCQALVNLMSKVTKQPPRMWGKISKVKSAPICGVSLSRA
jgi:hypothetical protein